MGDSVLNDVQKWQKKLGLGGKPKSKGPGPAKKLATWVDKSIATSSAKRRKAAAKKKK